MAGSSLDATLAELVRREVAEAIAPLERAVEAIAHRTPPAALSYKAAADYVMCSETHMRSLVYRGEIPVVALGDARKVIRRIDLDAYLERKTALVVSPDGSTLGGVPSGEATLTPAAGAA